MEGTHLHVVKMLARGTSMIFLPYGTLPVRVAQVQTLTKAAEAA